MAVGHKRHCLFESVMQSKSNKCIMHIDMPPPPFGSIGRRQARARGANNRVDLQIFLSPSHIGADHAYARRLLSACTIPNFFQGDICGGVIITQAWSPAIRIRNGAIFPSRKSRNGECINSTVVLSHSPTWSTRSHAAPSTAPLSPPFSPFRVRLRKGARDPSP